MIGKPSMGRVVRNLKFHTVRARNVYLLKNVQTGFGAHQDSYSVGTGVLSRK
jgi:hypothetical protein